MPLLRVAVVVDVLRDADEVDELPERATLLVLRAEVEVPLVRCCG